MEALKGEAELTTHNPKLLRELDSARAERLAARLTTAQLDACTRLPGER